MQVHIREWVVPFQVGVLEHEKGHPQPLIWTIQLAVRDPGKAEESLENTYDYSKVVRVVESLQQHPHTLLLETLAERLADSLLRDPEVFERRVRIEKKAILPAAKGIGIERVFLANLKT
jgi:dihydroneopterin aldolase